MQINIIEGRQEQKKKLKVCAYCRVSTDADEQENSLENQIRHYKDAIQSNPEYEYVGVYSDFAISGFKEKRPGLQQMLADARAGKIDLILTKSVSRFARNTTIVLQATRELKELNVGVFFELQNINTLSGEGELMLTILSAFAQAESESGSVGAKMVYQRKYEQGIPVQYLERSYGYTKNAKGEYVPEPSEAKWVKKIYEMAADGYTVAAITRFLQQGITHVLFILQNADYRCGIPLSLPLASRHLIFFQSFGNLLWISATEELLINPSDGFCLFLIDDKPSVLILIVS